MKTRCYCLLTALLFLIVSDVHAQSTAFTYQGRLNDGVNPANGNYDLRFDLRNTATGGSPVGTANTVAPVAVSNGLFTVTLDFGASAFDGGTRWLEIGVRTNGSVAGHFILSPRQAVTASPHAIHATIASTASNVVNGSVVKSLNGLKDNVTLAAGANVTISPSGNTLTIASTGGGGTGIWSLNGASTYYNGGRVGIGTDSPANKLTLLSSGYGLEHTDGNIRLGSYVGSGAGWLGTINNFPLSFFVNNGQASMTVGTNGNVGIGATTPQERLSIANAFGRSQGLRISGVGADGVGMALESFGPGGRKWSLVSGDIFNPLFPSIAGNFRVVDETANATRFVIAPDGNVGIGNLGNPQAKLDVQGNAQIDGNLTVNSTISGTAPTNGVSGTATGNGTGVYGAGGIYGVYGTSGGYGVYGKGAFGVFGETTSNNGGAAIQGVAVAGSFAGSFQGEVVIGGGLQVTGQKNFKIDHPLDPTNKYLVHSCIESPDRMNIYNGNVTTGGDGEAVVELPGYFSALNCDFRYQLTVLGQFAQAIVAKEIENNRFTIKTDKPNVKVSWQVTGVRQDAYARAHPMVVEQEKAPADKGHYLMPELFSQPPEKQIGRIAPERMQQREALKKTNHSIN
jgi:hypothetical protein